MQFRGLQATMRVIAMMCLFAVGSVAALAQNGAALTGTVTDSKGALVPGAKVTAHNEATGQSYNATADSQGHFSIANLPVGTYDVDAFAAEFKVSTHKGVHVGADQTDTVALTLQVSGATDQVTVEAGETGSVAAAYAPMDALLAETSARTEITSQYIQNFTAPTADYGEIVAMAPGTVTTSSDGVGMGQSKTFFRGFPDGDYDIDYDGIPFYDTNTPTHHSWVFFPSQWIGGVDFDRSPGTASTTGPTPFGGSIHLLSRDLAPEEDIRGSFSYGSFNTYLFDGQYDAGRFANNKATAEFDVQHMSSDGYQTYNYQTRNAGSTKMQYKFSDKTYVTGFSGVDWLDANTPNFNATRCQMYGPSATNSTTACVASSTDPTLLPYTNAGINFLDANNADPLDYLDYQYNYYHVVTDFEYVQFHSEALPWHLTVDVKPYTYDYDNGEKYSNATPITESTTVPYNGNAASTTWYGIKVAPCDVAVVKKGVTAIPCGVDKYNSYRKYGEVSNLTQTTKFGVLRAGMWYEWADTNRHQYPSDPLNGWVDQALPNFKEFFWTNSYQPFAEYEFHLVPKLNVILGTKFSHYSINTQQFADDGKTIGGLGTNNPASFVSNGGTYSAWLPSGEANYRIVPNWSVYAQVATGSVVPPSSVFDFSQGTSGQAIPVATLPKQQRSTTYQGGTVLKLKALTFDADAYHVRFQNSYSCVTTVASGGENVCFLQPSSITKGIEGEGNVYLSHGFNVNANVSFGRAVYSGVLPVSCVTGAAGCTSTTPQIFPGAPGYLHVQQSPSNIEGVTAMYQSHGFDLGLLDKRVGTFYIDNGAYHNQATITPFNTLNTFLNYTIRNGSRFDQTKIRLSVNNLLDSHSITGDSIAGTAVTTTIAANGTTYTDPFNTIGQTPISGADTISVLPGRSVILSVTFGISPKER